MSMRQQPKDMINLKRPAVTLNLKDISVCRNVALQSFTWSFSYDVYLLYLLIPWVDNEFQDLTNSNAFLTQTIVLYI